MASNRGRRWVNTLQRGSLPVYLYDDSINVDQQSYGVYPTKKIPQFPSRTREGGYSDNKFIANIQSKNDVAQYHSALDEIKNNIEVDNKDKYFKQISHIIRGAFATDDIGFKKAPTHVKNENSGLSDKQRKSLENYQRSRLHISMPEGKEFLANGNGRDAQIKKYLVKDGYIYEVDIEDGWGNGFVKANQYKATPENLEALRKGYDIYNLNRLLDRAKTDERWKAVLGEDISELLPSEIKLTNKVK